MKLSSHNIFSLLSFLLITFVPLLSAALTTFGKTPNASGRIVFSGSRPCNNDGDCASLKYSSCAKDPTTSRKLCLCADSKLPIGNSCDQIPTALHLPCDKDEQCVPNAGCMMNQTSGTKVCMCRDNSTEVGNVCNENSSPSFKTNSISKLKRPSSDIMERYLYKNLTKLKSNDDIVDIVNKFNSSEKSKFWDFYRSLYSNSKSNEKSKDLIQRSAKEPLAPPIYEIIVISNLEDESFIGTREKVSNRNQKHNFYSIDKLENNIAINSKKSTEKESNRKPKLKLYSHSTLTNNNEVTGNINNDFTINSKKPSAKKSSRKLKQSLYTYLSSKNDMDNTNNDLSINSKEYNRWSKHNFYTYTPNTNNNDASTSKDISVNSDSAADHVSKGNNNAAEMDDENQMSWLQYISSLGRENDAKNSNAYIESISSDSTDEHFSQWENDETVTRDEDDSNVTSYEDDSNLEPSWNLDFDFLKNINEDSDNYNSVRKTPTIEKYLDLTDDDDDSKIKYISKANTNFKLRKFNFYNEKTQMQSSTPKYVPTSIRPVNDVTTRRNFYSDWLKTLVMMAKLSKEEVPKSSDSDYVAHINEVQHPTDRVKN